MSAHSLELSLETLILTTSSSSLSLAYLPLLLVLRTSSGILAPLMCFLPHQLVCTPLDPFLYTHARTTHSLSLFCDSSAHCGTGCFPLSGPAFHLPFISDQNEVFSVTQHVPMAIVFISHTFFLL